MNPMRTRTKRAGFTLVELMIALTAGAFAVAGAYYLTGTSSRLFNEQMSVSEVQSTVRIAMEQIKRDIGRAGFLAARSRRELLDCAGQTDQPEVSPIAVDGFSVAIDQRTARTTALLNTTQNVLRTDRLVLNGNYASSDAYLIDPSYDAATGVIALQPGHESFIRSFTTTANDSAPPTFSRARFDAVFTDQRLVRIEHMQSGRVFFRRVTGRGTVGSGTDQTGSLTLDTPLPTHCFTPSEVAISPVVRIRYQVESPSDSRADFGLGYDDGSGNVASERTMLVRRELDTTSAATSDTMTPVPGSARVVLDYAVEFRVNAWYDDRSPDTDTRPLLRYASESIASGALTVANVSNNLPHRLRSAVVTLSARAPEADGRLGCLARPSLNVPLPTFRLPAVESEGDFARCARVRSLKAEIFMPNMAFRPGSM
jgi:prepilin-type N-terminal cleavage/methylation domain-containing protein